MSRDAEQDAQRVSRRAFLRGAGGMAALAALGGGTAALDLLEDAPALHPAVRRPTGAARHFRSRPDLRPAAVTVEAAARVAPGYLFVGLGAQGRTQPGPMILDNHGQPVWFRPLPGYLWEANFRPWTLHGQPVLAWWQGTVVLPVGYGKGEAVVVDRRYRELTRIRPAGGLSMDVHELQLTDAGTALFFTYPRVVEQDLRALGGPRRGRVLESVLQEVDVRTGRLLLQWRSLDHIPVDESYRAPADPFDYVHLNSIEIAPDGHLLLSGRHTFAVYKIHRRTGRVIWRLGGRRSDFALARGARFSWQHDARAPGTGTITLFDDGSDGRTRTEAASRGLVLEVDERRRQARVRREYRHPRPISSDAMGSVQTLPGGHVLVGWGSQPFCTEFDAEGGLIADVRLPRGQQSYRAYRLPWSGRPQPAPDLAVADAGSGGHRALYASWNGATAVRYWRLHAGPSTGALAPVALVRRRGFETALPLGGASGYVAVAALDRAGRQLAISAPVRV